MSFTETLTAILVLLGVFFLAYSAIRKQGILDTFREIKAIWQEKSEAISSSTKGVYQ